MANEIYDSTWWGNTIDTASSIGTSTEMIQGQINLTKLGDDLVVNGDFATDSDWNLRNAWVISNGICSLTSPNSDYLSQSNVFTANKSYKLTFDIIVNSGNLQPQFFDGGFQTVGTYSTSQSVEVNFLATSSGTLYFKPNSFDGSIDNVSVKEVRATTVEASKCLADAIHRIGIQDIQN